MSARAIQQRRLKRETKALVRSVGGLEVAAEDTGKRKSTVHRWTDPFDAEHFLNIDDLATLEAAAGAPVVTQLLCRMAGGVFVPVALDGAAPGAVADRFLDIVSDVGELGSGVRVTMGDGQVDAGEARQLRALLAELIAHAAALDAVLDGIEAGESGEQG